MFWARLSKDLHKGPGGGPNLWLASCYKGSSKIHVEGTSTHRGSCTSRTIILVQNAGTRWNLLSQYLFLKIKLEQLCVTYLFPDESSENLWID